MHHLVALLALQRAIFWNAFLIKRIHMLKSKASERFSKETHLSVRKCDRSNFFPGNTLISVKPSIKNGNGAWDILYNNKPSDAKCKFSDYIGNVEIQSNTFSKIVFLMKF